jgi:hypothetical protein
MKEIKNEILQCHTKWQQRVTVGTPSTGLVRIEWAISRYGQTIPTNWSQSVANEFMSTTVPLQYSVADAQNLIVRTAIENESEWLFLIEHDNLMPPDTFLHINEYMRDRKVPVVSALYFTKSDPPEPMIYRGSGTSYYQNWRIGDKVWATGVPTGTFLCHMSIMRAMWNESPEYVTDGRVTRRVFEQPAAVYYDPETGQMHTESGTTDIHWCERVMKGHFFEKAGWPKYQKMKYPFLVDTTMFIQHISNEGILYPITIPKKFEPLKRKNFSLMKIGKGEVWKIK